MFGMLSKLAELQRELIVANTDDGLAYARARGRVSGRRPKLTADQAELAQQYTEILLLADTPHLSDDFATIARTPCGSPTAQLGGRGLRLPCPGQPFLTSRAMPNSRRIRDTAHEPTAARRGSLFRSDPSATREWPPSKGSQGAHRALGRRGRRRSRAGTCNPAVRRGTEAPLPFGRRCQATPVR
ncbi:hypothetical protein GCM10017771_96700 [Streptomyces capitiformicae]|uniref:Resolvase/invertase-type recombinase catalytic domain-containing protein n=1 Tax=Streptomyces capitiformicae TaxID=2014920 RepID=A0A918ZWS4_9ACTN|nr:hypothetical protein GCM10017771_96700 [Streptomyces capitiformicae]